MVDTSKGAKFYINGGWVDPTSATLIDVHNPADESVIGKVALGSPADVERAVAAARAAFPAYAQTSREERLELLERICKIYKRRFTEMGRTISAEMGAPLAFATRMQAGAGLGHFRTALELLKTYPFDTVKGSTGVLHEPIGVVGMITPWNWPANQITCKVAPALATGCTMILKPSELAPFTALLLADILDEAGVPDGVFNLVNGNGPDVGAAIAAHPDIDMISFTGSTGAGVEVAIRAAPSVKRVGQELGGKAPNILLDDVDFNKAVRDGVALCLRNGGQSCNAPTRMLVPADRMEEVQDIAAAAAAESVVGAPDDEATTLGPVVSKAQWDKIQGYIKAGLDEGATLIAGGPGLPQGLARGYYVRPTVFANVLNSMTIAQEEIFGPVLAIIGYRDDDDAVAIANDSPFGLAAYVSGADEERARAVARRLRSGMVHINYAPADPRAPFGGYKRSGNGREWGEAGFEEFLETKAVMGWSAA
ncbi:MAG: aldehyde dehydrogenase family protein [Pseudomonadota bacterium]